MKKKVNICEILGKIREKLQFSGYFASIFMLFFFNLFRFSNWNARTFIVCSDQRWSA